MTWIYALMFGASLCGTVAPAAAWVTMVLMLIALLTAWRSASGSAVPTRERARARPRLTRRITMTFCQAADVQGLVMNHHIRSV